jgi:hypothetical protein
MRLVCKQNNKNTHREEKHWLAFGICNQPAKAGRSGQTLIGVRCPNTKGILSPNPWRSITIKLRLKPHRGLYAAKPFASHQRSANSALSSSVFVSGPYYTSSGAQKRAADAQQGKFRLEGLAQ